MNIVCPHCTTFYAVDPATLGPNGRMVRCARCKEVWQAQPEAARAEILAPAEMAGGDRNDEVEWNDPADAGAALRDETPIVDSPSIASEMPRSDDAMPAIEIDAHAEEQSVPAAKAPRMGWLRRRSTQPRTARRKRSRLPLACLGMAALVAALIVWRADMVRALPQTAQFYKFVGLEVNLRGLAFRDMKVSTETADDKPVLVIEGNIVDVGRKAVELPRLRFIVRDAQGGEIYAWNAVLEQPVLKPGEKAWFRSRLASPPPEGRSIDVRFFNKQDLVSGGI